MYYEGIYIHIYICDGYAGDDLTVCSVLNIILDRQSLELNFPYIFEI